MYGPLTWTSISSTENDALRTGRVWIVDAWRMTGGSWTVFSFAFSRLPFVPLISVTNIMLYVIVPTIDAVSTRADRICLVERSGAVESGTIVPSRTAGMILQTIAIVLVANWSFTVIVAAFAPTGFKVLRTLAKTQGNWKIDISASDGSACWNTNIAECGSFRLHKAMAAQNQIAAIFNSTTIDGNRPAFLTRLVRS